MTAMTASLYLDVMAVLQESGRQDLAEKFSAFEPKELLTSTEAARMLGLASPNTVKNWLEAGHFPGAYQTAGGHWRFPRQEVEAVQRRMEALRDRNRRRDLAPPDVDDDGTPPLL